MPHSWRGGVTCPAGAGLRSSAYLRRELRRRTSPAIPSNVVNLTPDMWSRA